MSSWIFLSSLSIVILQKNNNNKQTRKGTLVVWLEDEWAYFCVVLSKMYICISFASLECVSVCVRVLGGGDLGAQVGPPLIEGPNRRELPKTMKDFR